MWHVGEGQGGGNGGHPGQRSMGRRASGTGGRRGRREALSTLTTHYIPVEAQTWNTKMNKTDSADLPSTASGISLCMERRWRGVRGIQGILKCEGPWLSRTARSVPLSKQQFPLNSFFGEQNKEQENEKDKSSHGNTQGGEWDSHALGPETRGLTSQLCW